MEVLAYALQLALNVGLTHWVIAHDRRSLDARQLSRCWSPASHWSAVVGFNLLCIPLHFAKSRRSLSGFLLGLLWTAAVLVALSLAALGLDWAVGLRAD